MKLPLCLLFLFIALHVEAQVTLSHQVVGCAGASANLQNNVVLANTGGEAVIATATGGAITLTQGFHQPGNGEALTFSVETNPTTCPFAADGWATVTNISGCNPPYTITWSNGGQGEMVRHLTAGTYTVTVSAPGCRVSQEFEILPGPDENCEIYFLNAFSPNGDGINDQWDIENIEEEEYRDNRLEVYNRWGQLIWEGDNYDNSSVVWKGEDKNGETLSDGTYYYIATVAGIIYKGFIEITR